MTGAQMGIRLPHDCPDCNTPLELRFIKDFSTGVLRCGLVDRYGFVHEWKEVRGFEDTVKLDGNQDVQRRDSATIRVY